jgi:hypothetical protein
VSARETDLPEPEDASDERLVSDIRRYGWHCIHVADEHHPEHADLNPALDPHPVYDAAFSYTVGLWLSHSHPELVLVGRWEHAHAIIAAAVSLIEDGSRFEPAPSATKSSKATTSASVPCHRLDARSC